MFVSGNFVKPIIKDKRYLHKYMYVLVWKKPDLGGQKKGL